MPLQNSTHVERMVRRLRVGVDDLTALETRLRRAGWEEYALEDLHSAGVHLMEVAELLARHARRWRRQPLGGE